MAADEELYLNGEQVFEKRKIVASYHDRNPLTCWQDSKLLLHLAALTHDFVITATQVATARLDCSMQLCEDSCCFNA